LPQFLQYGILRDFFFGWTEPQRKGCLHILPKQDSGQT